MLNFIPQLLNRLPFLLRLLILGGLLSSASTFLFAIGLYVFALCLHYPWLPIALLGLPVLLVVLTRRPARRLHVLPPAPRQLPGRSRS